MATILRLLRPLPILLCLGLALWAGCLNPQKTVEPASKLDAPLRRAIAEQQQEGAHAKPLRVFVGCDDVPAEEQVRLLEADGLRVMATSGRIVLAEGSPDVVLKAARHSFVTQISLSQTRPPL